MSIADKLEKLNTDITNFYAAIEAKNGTLPENKNTENLVAALDTIKTSLVVIPPEAGNLIGIMITKYPNKLDYKEGESFDSTGLEVTSTYDNGVTGIVTGDCTLIGIDPLKPSSTQIIVQYEGYEAAIAIRVYGEFPPIPEGTIYLLHLDGNPTNAITGNTDYINLSTTYYIDSKFGKAVYDSHGYINNAKSTSSGIPTYAELLNGSKNMTITFWGYLSYSGGDALLYAEVGNNSDMYLFRIGIHNDTTVSAGVHMASGTAYSYTYYDTAKSIINSWHHFAITFCNGKIYFFFDGKKFHEAIPFRSGSDEKTPTIHFGRNYARIDELLVTTSALWTADFEPPSQPYGGVRILSGLKLQTQPIKTVYQVGELFDLTGAKIIATYTDGSNINVTNECIIIDDYPITGSEKFKKITYTYEGITKEVYVNISAYTVEPTFDLTEAKLLLPFDGSSEDLVGGNTVTVMGNNLFSTIGNGKFGNAKYFNGSNVYLTLPYNDNINFDTGDFTIAFWAYDLGGTSQRDVVTCYKNYSGGGFLGGFRIGVFSKRTDMYCALFKADGTNFEVVPTYTAYLHTNEWTHYALVRSGDTFTFYENGITKGTYVYDGALHNSTKLVIGARDVSTSASESFSHFFNGYIDDFIITKSALWTSDFTPPTRPFADIIE